MCTRSVETVPNTICVYNYVSETIPTEAVTVRVEYSTPCESQMVTVCDPGYGYGHDVHCKEVAQETCYNKPELLEDVQEKEVIVPAPQEVCVDKPLEVVRVTCEDLTSEKCITVPEVEAGEVEAEVCRTVLAAPACNTVTLDLPQEQCIDIVYGYAHGYDHGHAPAPHTS